MPRKWFQFWIPNESTETNAPQPSAGVPTHEFNSNMGVAYIQSWGGSTPMPYSVEQIRAFMQNPMENIHEIRYMAHWAYCANGVVSSAIDYLKSMYTLDGVVVCKSKRPNGEKPRNYKSNKAKMEATLNTIRYKQMIRDAIFKDANDGMYAAYFETNDVSPGLRGALTDYDVSNIVEINDIGLNATVIPLPIDYVRIVARRNNSYQIAFDMRYFEQFTDDMRKRKLAGFPREIQEGWLEYENDSSAPWKILDNDKTIVTKIKSQISDPYGIPFAIAALDDISYAQYFIDTKRNVLASVNNQILYEVFPEGKDKGTSALSEKGQKLQHDTIKQALANRNVNLSSTSFFSLAAGTKMDAISLDSSILDEEKESSIEEDVNQDLGFSASALDGSSSGNYSTATLNLELVASNVYTWIDDIVTELNKCINKNIIKDSSCRVEFYIPPITMVNKDKMVGYMADLYARGKGSLYAWIAATGFDPDNYMALMDFELQEDIENRYPVHRTSYTTSGNEDTDDIGGRPSEDSQEPSSIQGKTNGANEHPKPSG